MFFEITTLACPILAVTEVGTAAAEWVTGSEARGTLLGCWRSEIGTLGRLFVLRSFETADELMAERHRALGNDRPFNVDGSVSALDMQSYAPFPFLPPVRIGARGGIFEIRTYRIKPGGLPPTLAGWKEAIGPAKAYTDHLVTAMYALDGPPRITHIWGFTDLAERFALRSQGYAAGVWPPKGGPEQIVEATSTIALPERFSPLT